MKSLLLLLLTAPSLAAVEPSTTLMQRILRIADKSNDGKLTLEEYKPLDVQARHHGDEHFKAGDKNGDGFIDATELAAALSKQTWFAILAEGIEASFTRIDTNKDRKLDAPEYRRISKMGGHSEQHFKGADSNKDSFLDFSEFTAHAEHRLAALNATEAEPKGRSLAFPSAEGHGAFTRGGRGGRVVHVTTLNKRGPGSLAWAINEVKECRTIVFDVSGVIDCNNEIGFTITPENDHVTIAGETSPHGVAVYDYRRFDISGEEVIMRFMRFRGTRIHTKNDPDCLLMLNARNVLVDHCSFAGACDETFDTSRSESITVQWCGIDASRKAEAHADFFENNGQWHNYGSLHSRSKRITIHHCLYAHQSKRCPLTDDVSDVEAINNVIYNYSNSQQTWGAEGPGLTIVNCFFKLGPDRRKNAVPVNPNAHVIRGCVSREADMRPGPPGPDQGPEPSLSLPRIDTAEEAYTRVLAQAGAMPHDATSNLMVTDTRRGTGKQGYEDRIAADRAVLEKETPVIPDSDQDGLPDEWERAHALNPSDASDASDLTPDGYTELERYCHHLAARLVEAATQ